VTFKTKAEGILHTWIYHQNQNEKMCPVCCKFARPYPSSQAPYEFLFYFEDKLMSRTKNVFIHLHHHTGERVHKCSKCTKAFYDLSSLQKHMNTHMKRKPFVCPICQDDFAQKANLKKHLFKMHKYSN
jgi:uncharacterized Zn-finger protein